MCLYPYVAASLACKRRHDVPLLLLVHCKSHRQNPICGGYMQTCCTHYHATLKNDLAIDKPCIATSLRHFFGTKKNQLRWIWQTWTGHCEQPMANVFTHTMQAVICRPTFQQLVEILTEIEVEFRRECHRQRPAMAVGAASNSPSPPGKRRSVGLGGVPLPGAKKPPSRFSSGIDSDAGSFSATTASPMLYSASSAQSEAAMKAGGVPSRQS